MACRGERELAGSDETARRLDAFHRAVGAAADRSDFAMLDDVDALGIRAARIAPGDGVVANRAAARLQEPALYGKARIVEIEERNARAHLFAVEQFRVDAVQAHRIAAPDIGVALAV